MVQCKDCLQDKVKIRTNKKCGSGFVYVDTSGKPWAGRVCPHCRLVRVRQAHYRAGRHAPIEKVTHSQIVRAREAEKMAADYFQAQGFEVLRGAYNGPDLFVTKDGVTKTVEVKLAYKIASSNCIRVSQVKPNRVNDDLIAIVFEDLQTVHIEEMTEHLRSCSRDNSRSVTRLYLELGGSLPKLAFLRRPVRK